jgi:hypothetical protein
MYCVAYTRKQGESRPARARGRVIERDARRGDRRVRRLKERMQETAPMTADGKIDPSTLEQLQRLARSRPRTGREAQAKASAIRTLERLARDGRRPELAACPPDWYPPNQAEFEELDRAHLEEHPEVRQRMWEIWQGY